MAHPQKEPLRPLTAEERAVLERLRRARHEGVDRVARATLLLAVADGACFTAAAQQAGRRSARAVAGVVVRCNARGLAALDARHGGGPPVVYGVPERERMLEEFRRPPIASGMGPPPGRWRRCSRRCGGGRTGCRG